MIQASHLDNKFSIVDSLPLFSDLSFLQKRFIAAKCQIDEFQKGQGIYNEGDPPDYFYCMITGRVEMYHPANKTKERRNVRIDCLRKGYYFGSISSFTGKPHTASAKALNDSLILKIDTKNFNQILHKIPRLAVFLSHALSRRLSSKGHKEVFESTIISVYSFDKTPASYAYAVTLANSLRSESGKKVLVIKASSIHSKKEVSSKLSSLTGEYHYVLVHVPPILSSINFEVLKQSDTRHIVSSSDKK